MQVKPMRREFSFSGFKPPDPNPKLTVEDVRGILAMQYPEIATVPSPAQKRPGKRASASSEDAA
ncbi:MAG: PRTRC system protein C [Bryobacterales bacterium]|nr:PRTRC system protein C [Bryobacterales bacterium]